jgi:hypothetical protein
MANKPDPLSVSPDDSTFGTKPAPAAGGGLNGLRLLSTSPTQPTSVAAPPPADKKILEINALLMSSGNTDITLHGIAGQPHMAEFTMTRQQYSDLRAAATTNPALRAFLNGALAREANGTIKTSPNGLISATFDLSQNPMSARDFATQMELVNHAAARTTSAIDPASPAGQILEVNRKLQTTYPSHDITLHGVPAQPGLAEIMMTPEQYRDVAKYASAETRAFLRGALKTRPDGGVEIGPDRMIHATFDLSRNPMSADKLAAGIGAVNQAASSKPVLVAPSTQSPLITPSIKPPALGAP